jgi:hypothetical protein
VINLAPIDRSHDVAAAAVAVTGRQPYQKKRAGHDQASSPEAVTIFQVISSATTASQTKEAFVIGNL